MKQDEIIEMAEQAGMTQDGDMWFSFGKGDMDVEHEHLVAFAKLVAAKAIAELESQEPVAWNRGVPPVRPQQKEGETFIVSYEDTHPPQRTEQNFCPRCGKRTNDIHTCTPPQRTEQEPVKLPCCGYTDASAVKWNPFNCVVQCHNCGQTYTQLQRTWVGLTDEERNAIEAATLDLHGVPKFFATAIEAKLKERNA
jgi:hypothetical protein